MMQQAASKGQRLRYVLPLLLHLAPVVPFAMGYVYAGIATVFFVGLVYIKTTKLSVLLRSLEEQAGPPPRIAVVEKELDAVRSTRDMWRSLTFGSPEG